MKNISNKTAFHSFWFYSKWSRVELSCLASGRLTLNSSTNDNYVVKETATINWTINGFRSLNSHVYSKKFSPPNSKNIFLLHLKPRTSFFNADEVCISLFYYENETELPMRYRVSTMDSNGEKQYTQEYYWKYFKTENGRHNSRNFTSFINYYDCSPYLVHGNLILNCEVDILEENKAVSLTNKTVEAATGQTNLQNDYQVLLENSEFSDVVLMVKKKEFKVHKNILAARSKVLRAMFSNDLEEKKQNRVEITDVEVDVFEHLLRYIYTGKVPETNEYALELFVVADKYQLDHLKSLCEQSLGTNITTDSVASVLIIADMHNASELKLKCIKYINANSVAVKKTKEWNQIKSRAALLLELYDNLTAKLELMST